MTEKRFTFKEINLENEPFRYSIMRDNLTKKPYDNSIKGLFDIVILCNALWEQTKRFETHNQKLIEENEQLKSQINDTQIAVEIETEKCMQRVFALVDKKIDELEGRYKFGQEVCRSCPMHDIRFGINTLKGLKKELQEK